MQLPANYCWINQLKNEKKIMEEKKNYFLIYIASLYRLFFGIKLIYH